MPPKPRNWLEPAGVVPDTGEDIRVCDLVARGEEILGVGHNPDRAGRWRQWWSSLTKEQREHCKTAKGKRPRSRS